MYRYSLESNAVIQDEGIGLPNGLAFNEKLKKFYFIDSLAFDVKEYDYDVESGDVSMYI